MSYAGLYGLGQAKTGTSSGKTGTSVSAPDRTASDWASGLTAIGPIIGSVIGAATGQPAATATPTEQAIDPATAYAPPASASPGWYWPTVIGVGAAVLVGIGYVTYNAKKPIKANRRRRHRRCRHRR